MTEIIYKKIVAPWKPEKEGDEISGKILRIRKDVGENQSMMYDLETETEVKGVWGTAVIDDEMKFFEVGDHVRIIFKGKKQGDKKEYNDFDVFKGFPKD